MREKENLFKAITFASEKHEGQFRKGVEVPYITHPLRVAERLIRIGCSEELATAAVLHDVVEDTSATLDQVRSHFGNYVANIVKGVSEADKSLPWQERKEHTINYLKEASSDELILSMADKLDNLSSIKQDLEYFGEHIWDRLNNDKDAQGWYYRSLLEIYRSQPDIQSLSMFNEYEKLVEEVFETVYE